MDAIFDDIILWPLYMFSKQHFGPVIVLHCLYIWQQHNIVSLVYQFITNILNVLT